MNITGYPQGRIEAARTGVLFGATTPDAPDAAPAFEAKTVEWAKARLLDAVGQAPDLLGSRPLDAAGVAVMGLILSRLDDDVLRQLLADAEKKKLSTYRKGMRRILAKSTEADMVKMIKAALPAAV